MKKLTVILAVLTVLAFTTGVMAQATKPAPAAAPGAAPAAPEKAAKPAPEKAAKAEKFSGSIQKVDEAGKAITVKGKKEEKTFFIGDTTKMMRGKTELAFADLKKGTDVSVEYKKEGDKNVAASIKAAAPKSGEKKEPKK
jgi:hypothetical protein